MSTITTSLLLTFVERMLLWVMPAKAGLPARKATWQAGIQTEVLWIPAGVYPRLGSRFRLPAGRQAGTTNSGDGNDITFTEFNSTLLMLVQKKSVAAQQDSQSFSW